MVAPLFVPSSMGCCLDEEEQLFVGLISSASGAGGAKRATIAVAHNLLVIAYYILPDQTCYQDLGPDYFDRLNPEGLRRRLTKRLAGLGFKVTVEPLAQVV
jgi:hypothetical protein